MIDDLMMVGLGFFMGIAFIKIMEAWKSGESY